ncbi:DUF423 domain-containing protein [Cohnella yongneupensis]|uniref:DUF423 domain-containing protein n=1 Tax=Cohnella yongneupensis TaxID=425006 RepID=A0ABW0QZ54_9BACL
MIKYTKIGALAAMLSVVLGAFGAHALKDKLTSDMMDVYETGVQYHMFHAVAILLVALLIERLPRQRLALWAARLLLAGIVLFSGSLYALALSGMDALGAITPLGGVAFIAGWICLALAARPLK